MTSNNPASPCTMTMYYHMYGPAIGGLAVYTRYQFHGHLTKIWERKQEVGNYFARVSIDTKIASQAAQVC